MPAISTFSIPSANFGILVEKLGKLARRAAKLGRIVPVINELSVEDREYKERDGFGKIVTKYRRFHNIQIESEPVCVNGWTFVATIEMGDSEIGNIINQVPEALAEGESLPVEFRKTTGFCDHCKTSRRRNAVYVLRHNETGEWKQVGRNCLGQFLGGVDPANICANLEYINDFITMAGGAEDDNFFGRSGQSLYSLRGFLETVDLIIRCKGWLSRSKARQNMEEFGGSNPATVDLLKAYYADIKPKPEVIKEIEAFISENEPNEERVEDAIAWARSLATLDDINDYLHNLTVVCSKESLDPKHAGIAASLFAAFDFANNVQKQKAEQAAKPASEWIGTIKKRETFILTLKRIHVSSNHFGISNGCFFETPNGDKVTWWASGEVDMEVDKTYKVTASVKDHTEYKGVKQTVLTRAKYVPAE